MKIIDFEKRGNTVRFFLGEKTKDWGWTNEKYTNSKGERPDWLKPSDVYYGDDWDDRPYECNAGTVYSEFIKGYKDIYFPFDATVLEPCNGEFNSQWCKDDMVARRVPCIIVMIPEPAKSIDDILGRWPGDRFSYFAGSDSPDIQKYYFGDEMEPDIVF